jgi:hypothetical protein
MYIGQWTGSLSRVGVYLKHGFVLLHLFQTKQRVSIGLLFPPAHPFYC